MIQPIVLYSSNHKILRTKTKDSDVQNDRDNLLKLIGDMKDTLKSIGGLGLAANQLGRDESICLVNIEGKTITMVNPQIIEKFGDTKISIEGCLSLPDISVRVNRHENITVRFFNPDEDWQEQEIKVNFPNSVIIQHELDHLNGKLMIDHITPFEKTLISTKLKRVARGNTNINYVGMIWRESVRSWSLVGPYYKLLEFYSYHSNNNSTTNGESNGNTVESQIGDWQEKERKQAEENTAGKIEEHKVSENS